ncbi:signal recognition particle receptor subunit beta [Catalinimonas alkaloidigena]|uniref:hypothetical protein n=1 Tax=Catalinimonas alkaloidigena TaxID=1075417 RepID=UPI002407637E|nr:hypothetical protein [Catalinimonas alkaloidigena]MDF9797970.1 signal recognition particle receptor subunit beta [Catalinimonas alkaloidigena]
MKFLKAEILFILLIITSCTDEQESMSIYPSLADNTEKVAFSAESSSSTVVKNTLYDFAQETLSDMYGVKFKLNETTLLDKASLLIWIAQNKKNKSSAINKENQRLLSKLFKQDDIKAILINTPGHAKFQQAVYILVPKPFRVEDFNSIGAVLITDSASSSSDSDEGGGNGGNDDGGDDDDEDEDAEEVCYTQSGTYLDATQQQNSDNPLSGCPPCLVECVDCNSSLAGQDDCVNCSV